MVQRRALIIGIDSKIGGALHDVLMKSGWLVFASSRRPERINELTVYLDLTNAATFSLDHKIDVVFLCANITSLAACEGNEALARRINVDAQLILARYFISKNVHVVYLSSNAVFNGLKPYYKLVDHPDPVTVYGQQKLAVENALLASASQVSIVRLTKVFTPDYPLIVQWINALRRGELIMPYNDLFLSPLPIDIVTSCLLQIAEKRLYGVFHLSGEENVTYAQVADCLARLLGVSNSLIESKSVIESSALAESPIRFGSLDISESKKIFNLPSLSLLDILQSLYGESCFTHSTA